MVPKVDKSMPQGNPKVISLHEKWTLGRPRVGCWDVLARFWTNRKSSMFVDVGPGSKKSTKSTPRRPSRATGRSGNPAVAGIAASGCAGRRPLIKEIDESMEKTTVVEGLTRHGPLAWRILMRTRRPGLSANSTYPDVARPFEPWPMRTADKNKRRGRKNKRKEKLKRA